MSVVVGLALAVAGVTVAPRAWADTTSLNVTVEIAEEGKGVARDALTAVLALVGDRGCSTVESRREATDYEVRVCREGGDAHTPLLSFVVERRERHGRTARTAKFQVRSRVTVGRRVVIGKVAQAGGRSTQVTARVR